MVPALILDLIFLAVLILFIVLGAHRGLVLTLCGLLALFVAVCGAAFVSNALCEPMGDVLQPAIESRLNDALQREAASTVAGTIPKAEDLPLEELLEALKSSGMYQSLADSFQQSVHQGIAKITGSAAQSLSQYIARTVARAVLFVLFFLVILVAWFLLSHALDLVAKLPVLSTINRVGGGIVGAIKGFLFLCVGVWFLHTLLGLIPAQAAQGSYLLPILLHPMELVQQVHSLM